MTRKTLVGIICGAVVAVGGGLAQESRAVGAEVSKSPGKVGGDSATNAVTVGIPAKDNKGREWLLEDWKEGMAKFPAPEDGVKYKEWLKDVTRPYPKDLKAREEWYLKKNGENWDGPEKIHKGAGWILTPGNWKWEVVATVPEDIDKILGECAPGYRPWFWRSFGGSWSYGNIYAPGAGEATDLYCNTVVGFLHVDLKTRKCTFIGKFPAVADSERGKSIDKQQALPGEWCKDGIGDAIRIAGSCEASVDVVTGRLFWPQSVTSRNTALRCVEKLLPYKDKADGKEYLLPALLDFKELYKKVKSPTGGELEPVMKNGKRADPVFAARTMSKVGTIRFPGAGGRRILLTPDGKGVYVADGGTSNYEVMNFDGIKLCDLETGVRTPMPLKGAMPPNSNRDVEGPGSHGGVCAGVDGFIYTSQHGGCGRYPMQLVWFNPETGMSGALYSSLWGKWDRAIADKRWDGPADAQYLLATSTCQQTQCPRTGAILNGGWDGSGMRHYQDGFVTTMITGQRSSSPRGRLEWTEKDAPRFSAHNVEVGIAPNGDMYVPDNGWGGATDGKGQPKRILRYYRTDWPKEQPEYGYGEKFMPKAKLEELMLEYAKKYVANYEANNKF